MRSKKLRSFVICAAIGLCGLWVVTTVQVRAQSSAATSSSSGLVTQLTKGLSSTPTQARGGAGTLFALAKSHLSTEEFSKIASAVPGMSGFLKAAPPLSQNSEFSGLESALPGNMGRTVEAAEAFHKLGLSPEMAAKFVPIMSKFVETKGGSSTAALLEKGLK
jgi:Protein of unknown function VcgC/VcgE (DUF2780)